MSNDITMDKKTSEYVIAYLDMLGTSDRANDSEKSNSFLNRLYYLYKIIKEDSIREGCGEVEVRFSSDSIIIAAKLSDQYMRTEGIKNVLYWATRFQSSSATDEISCLVRGSITIGQLFIDELMVYGSALVRAVELEKSIAIYPRVVIDPEKLTEFSSLKEANQFLLEDFDGIYFLNYMGYLEIVDKSVKECFETIKSEAPRKKNNSYKDKVYQKLCWHVKYMNIQLKNWNPNSKGISL